MHAIAPGGWQVLGQDFAESLEFARLTNVAVRLLIAALLGGMLGYEREKSGKAAGLRTHILVATGAAFFVIAPRLEGISTDAMSRVIQGLITGIGFLGGGAILKLTDARQIRGLTTAAGIWLTAAVGIAVGLGQIGAALVAAILAFVILGLLSRLDPMIGDNEEKKEGN